MTIQEKQSQLEALRAKRAFLISNATAAFAEQLPTGICAPQKFVQYYRQEYIFPLDKEIQRLTTEIESATLNARLHQLPPRGHLNMTKRGFLQAIGSALTLGKAAQLTQGTKNMGLPLIWNNLNSPDLAAYSQALPPTGTLPCTLSQQFRLPAGLARDAVEYKKRLLRDLDHQRSGQFTSHEEKHERWLRRQQYRKYMCGPWRDKTKQLDIASWSRNNNSLDDIQKKINALMKDISI